MIAGPGGAGLRRARQRQLAEGLGGNRRLSGLELAPGDRTVSVAVEADRMLEIAQGDVPAPVDRRAVDGELEIGVARPVRAGPVPRCPALRSRPSRVAKRCRTVVIAMPCAPPRMNLCWRGRLSVARRPLLMRTTTAQAARDAGSLSDQRSSFRWPSRPPGGSCPGRPPGRSAARLATHRAAPG